MSILCYKATLGDLAVAISSTAAKAYKNHTEDTPLSDVEQKKAYKDLLETVSKYFYNGDLTSHLTSMQADARFGESGYQSYVKELLRTAMLRLETSVDNIKKSDPNANKNPKSHMFSTPLVSMYENALKQYLDEHPREQATTGVSTQTNIGEPGEVPVIQGKQPEVITATALMKRLIDNGGPNAKYLSDIDKYLTHVVATSHVDGRVDPTTGQAKGFTGLRDTAIRVKSQLHSRIYNYFASRSNGSFTTMDNGVATRYLVYTPDRIPIGFSEGKVKLADGILLGEHQDFNKVATDKDNVEPVKIIIAPDFDSAQKAVLTLAPGIVVVDPTPNQSAETDFTKIAYTNPDQLNENDLPVFFSHVLTNGNNFEVFLENKFKPLAKAYKERYRSAWESEDSPVSGTDQDSAATKMHKLSTPRLTKGPRGTLVIDNDNKLGAYLTIDDFAMASDRLPKLGSDYLSIAEALNKQSNTEKNSHLADVYRSIYYRFFHPDDYKVNGFRNPVTNIPEDGVTMRSYKGIANAQAQDVMSVEDYNALPDRSVVPSSSNAALEDSISAMITSFRSTVVNEQYYSRNGIGQETNIAGHGATVDGFNTNFLGATTNTDEAGGVTTKRQYFYNDRVAIFPVEGKKNRLMFKIKTEDGRSNLVYEADVNLTQNESDPMTRVFQHGIPLTIVNKNQDYDRGTLASIFSGFGFPKNVTDSRYLDAVYNSISSSDLQIQANAGQITPAGKKPMDTTVDNLYLNMLFTMVLNSEERAGSPLKTLKTILGDNLPKPSEDGLLKYNPLSVLYGYKQAISNIMVSTEGEYGKKMQQNYEGNSVAVNTVNKAIKRTDELANLVDENSIHYGNVLTPGNKQYVIGPQTFVKSQLKIGDDIKSPRAFTEKENAKILLENAFLQTARNSSGFNKVLIQNGAFSDRSHSDLTSYKAIGGHNSIFLQTDNADKTNGWENSTWKNKDVKTLLNLPGNKISAEEATAVRSHDGLKALLDKYKIPYQTLKENTNLTRYGRIFEDNNGNAYVPASATKNESGLDTHALARKALDVHQGYYKGIDRVVSKSWETSINSLKNEKNTFGNLQQVSDYLKSNPTSYSDLKAESGMIDMAMIGQDDEGNATVPEDVLQSIALFKNDTLGLAYIETMRKMFHSQLADVGYTSLSPRSVRYISKNIMRDATIRDNDARDILFDSYFYNAQILGQSALNLHTGGVEQYDLKPKGSSMFNTKVSFKDGRIDSESVLKQANAIKVPGTKETLGSISVNDLLAMRGQDADPMIERLAHMKIILENNDAFKGNELKATALIFNDFTKHTGDKFVSQVKRNAVLGSGIQMPRITGDNEPGFYLNKSSKNITVADDEPMVKVLGLSGGKQTTATDGVQQMHPLYEMMMNNAIGNDESSFKYNGVAVKDLTIENDKQGFSRDQKKATFGMSSNELLKFGSPIGEQQLKKANTAVEFSSRNMLVDTKGIPEWHQITPELWKLHGLSYSYMKHMLPDNTAEMVPASRIYNDMKTGKISPDSFKTDLESEKYYSAKVAKTFNNLQELWEYHGASMNDNAWKTVSDILGYHSGNETTQMDLSDAKYPLRNAFIEKIGYTSQEKTGAKNVISWENLLDPNYQITRHDADGFPHKRWSEVSNANHGLILQSEHNFDTTSSHNKVRSADNQDIEDNMVSLITQIISASSAEGMSIFESKNINDTIGILSKAALEGKKSEILNKVANDNELSDDDRTSLLNKIKHGDIGDSPMEVKLKDAIEDYARDLVSRRLAIKSDDPGLAAELLSSSYKESLTFDQKQLLPLVMSTIFADFNSKAVRMKFPGGQFVVSPSHKFLPTYELKLGGRTLMSGMNREDMNTKFYGEEYHKLTDVQRAAVAETYPMNKITDFNKIMLSDIVRDPNGNYRRLIDIKNELRENHTGNADDSEKFVEDAIKAGDYTYRLGAITPNDEKPLNWTNWERYDAAGSKHSVMDSDEFKAWDTIDPLTKKYKSGVTFDKAFNIDLSKTPVEKKAKAHPRFLKTAGTEITNAEIKGKVPMLLAREFYFDKIAPVESRGAALIGPAKEKEFLTWLSTTDGIKMAKDVYEHIGSNSIADPEYKNRFKSHLYNLLQDENMKWTPTLTETYMPHMHASAYLIRTGEDGRPADSLMDIIGLNEIPSTNKLESMGIMSHQEAIDHSFNYDKAFNDFKVDNDGKYHTLPPAHQDLYNNYTKSVEDIRSSMSRFFDDRVRELYSTKQSGRAKIEDSTGNLFVFPDRDIDNMLNMATRKHNTAIVGSSHYEAMGRLIDRLNLAKTNRNLSQKFEPGSWIFQSEYDNFVNKRVTTLSNNFLKTLEFISARIPAQGKQSFTGCKIKNFIFSSKNSIYNPLELILLAGADYDIDKQNLMTWSVDKDGDIVPWQHYMDTNGKLSIDVLNKDIASNIATVRDNFSKTIADRESKLELLLSQQNKDDAPIGGVEATQLADRINSARNGIDSLKSGMNKAVETAETQARMRFIQAGQNFVVHNLMEVISSPKNAIESSTPISSSKLTDTIKLPDISKMFKGRLNIGDLFRSQRITNGINPFSTIEYERICMAGKSGVGITASDLKAYLASFYATRTATADEQNHITFGSDITNLPKEIADRFNIDQTGLQFFSPDKSSKIWDKGTAYSANEKVQNGKYVYTAIHDIPAGTEVTDRDAWKLVPIVTNNKTLANTARWTSEGKTISDRAKQGIAELKASNPEDVDSQVAIISKYMDDVKSFNSMNVSSQAWEDLSQLLTAATDNAKELILGKIGVNNTTNSLVSTMVRMGVNLKDAVNIINSDRVLDIVKSVEADNDLFNKQEKARKAASEGIVYEDKYAEQMVDKLKADLPDVPGKDASDEKIYNYLTDPVRQLYTYTKASLEFSSLSKMLSINQGLKTDAFEVRSYISSIDNSMNKAIVNYNKDHKDAPINLTFSIEKFVGDVAEGNTEKVNDMINAFNKVRTGINVPFVLMKNAHYFGYFEAMFQAKQIRDSLSYINSHAETIIQTAKELYGDRSIQKPMYKKLTDTLYDFGVLSYLKSAAGKDTPLVLRGITYDLSLPKTDGKSLGRMELIQNLRDILDTIKGNDFVDSLKLDRVRQDKLTGIPLKVIKGPNLNLVPSDVFAKLQGGLEQIKLSEPELHKALFYYGLIATKGAYGGGSFTGLFNIKDYLEFSDYLKKNSSTIFGNIQANNKLIIALNPLLLRQHSTTPAKEDTSIQYDDPYDQEMEQPFDFEDDMGGNDRSYNRDLSKYNFILDPLNRAMRDPNNNMPKDEMWRSKNSDLVYRWNELLQIFVPQTREVPELAIPYSIPDPLSNAEPIQKDSGYISGFRANMPMDVRVKAENGEYITKHDEGTIISYITEGMKSDVDPKNVTPALNDLANLLYSDEARIFKEHSNMYIVQHSNGRYSTASAEELLKANPGMVLDEGHIKLGSKELDNIDNKVVPTWKLFEKNGEYFNKPVEGATPVPERELPVVANGLTNAIYDRETIDSMVSKVSKGNIDGHYNADQVDKQYKNYTDLMLDNLLVATIPDINAEDAARIRTRTTRQSDRTQDAVAMLRSRIDNTLGNAPTTLDKLSTLVKGPEGFNELYSKLQNTKTSLSVSPTSDRVEFPAKNTIPKAAYDLLDEKVAQNNVTQMSMSDFRLLHKTLGLPDEMFKSYVNTKFLPETGANALMLDSDAFLAKGEKISSTKLITNLNKAVEASKEISIPNTMKYQYMKPASKDVMFALTKHLNERLPGVRWLVLSPEEITKRYGEHYATDKGFFKTNGTVVVNSANATLETPIHEFGHVYLQYLAVDDPAEYKKAMELSQDHPLFNTMRKAYPELSNIDVAEETFSELLSMSATEKLMFGASDKTKAILNSASDTTGPFGRMIKAIKDVFGNLFGTKEPINLGIGDSLGSIINKLSDDILYGKESMLSKFSNETKDAINKLRNNSTFTTKEAREALMSRGYIEWYCV